MNLPARCAQSRNGGRKRLIILSICSPTGCCPLRIGIDDQHSAIIFSESACKLHADGRFPASPLLIYYSYYLGFHKRLEHSEDSLLISLLSIVYFIQYKIIQGTLSTRDASLEAENRQVAK